MPAAASRSAASMRSCACASKLRTVPVMVASAGSTLWLLPPCTWVTDSTADSAGSMRRATMVFSCTTSWLAASSTSGVRCGCAAWPPRPRSTMSKRSAAAMIGPGPRLRVAQRQVGPVVQRVHRVAREALEQALLDHHPRTAAALLGRLEDEVHRAVEAARARELACRAEQHRGVAVVAAAVVHAGDAGSRSARRDCSAIGSASMSARRPTAAARCCRGAACRRRRCRPAPRALRAPAGATMRRRCRRCAAPRTPVRGARAGRAAARPVREAGRRSCPAPCSAAPSRSVS